jgi:hypothetical protein
MKLAKRALLWAKQNKKAVAFGLASAAGSAMAEGETGVDATVIVTALTALGVTIAVVGNARLVMDLAVKSFRWIRGALS